MSVHQKMIEFGTHGMTVMSININYNKEAITLSEREIFSVSDEVHSIYLTSNSIFDITLVWFLTGKASTQKKSSKKNQMVDGIYER